MHPHPRVFSCEVEIVGVPLPLVNKFQHNISSSPQLRRGFPVYDTVEKRDQIVMEGIEAGIGGYSPRSTAPAGSYHIIGGPLQNTSLSPKSSPSRVALGSGLSLPPATGAGPSVDRPLTDRERQSSLSRYILPVSVRAAAPVHRSPGAWLNLNAPTTWTIKVRNAFAGNHRPVTLEVMPDHTVFEINLMLQNRTGVSVHNQKVGGAGDWKFSFAHCSCCQGSVEKEEDEFEMDPHPPASLRPSGIGLRDVYRQRSGSDARSRMRDDASFPITVYSRVRCGTGPVQRERSNYGGIKMICISNLPSDERNESVFHFVIDALIDLSAFFQVFSDIVIVSLSNSGEFAMKTV